MRIKSCANFMVSHLIWHLQNMTKFIKGVSIYSDTQLLEEEWCFKMFDMAKCSGIWHLDGLFGFSLFTQKCVSKYCLEFCLYEFTCMVVSQFSVDLGNLNHSFKNGSLWIWIHQFWLLLKNNLIYTYLPCQGHVWKQKWEQWLGFSLPWMKLQVLESPYAQGFPTRCNCSGRWPYMDPTRILALTALSRVQSPCS